MASPRRQPAGPAQDRVLPGEPAPDPGGPPSGHRRTVLLNTAGRLSDGNRTTLYVVQNGGSADTENNRRRPPGVIRHAAGQADAEAALARATWLPRTRCSRATPCWEYDRRPDHGHRPPCSPAHPAIRGAPIPGRPLAGQGSSARPSGAPLKPAGQPEVGRVHRPDREEWRPPVQPSPSSRPSPAPGEAVDAPGLPLATSKISVTFRKVWGAMLSMAHGQDIKEADQDGQQKANARQGRQDLHRSSRHGSTSKRLRNMHGGSRRTPAIASPTRL